MNHNKIFELHAISSKLSTASEAIQALKNNKSDTIEIKSDAIPVLRIPDPKRKLRKKMIKDRERHCADLIKKASLILATI